MHPNAEFARSLVIWRDTKKESADVIADAQRRGLVTRIDDNYVLTRKGVEFISKWTSGKPSATYQRKPSQGIENDSFSRYSTEYRSRGHRDSYRY